MKLSILTLLCACAIQSIAQKSLSIKAGPSYSYVHHSKSDFGRGIGYFAGLVYEDKFSENLSFITDANYLKQSFGYNDIDSRVTVESINVDLGTNIYPKNFPLIFTLAWSAGYAFRGTANDEDVTISRNIRIGYVVGAGLKLDRFMPHIRFNGALLNSHQGFNFNVQAGVMYRLF